MAMLKGVTLEEALRRTSDPDEYREWVDAERRSKEHPDRKSEEARQLDDLAWEQRRALERDLAEMLISGDLTGSGFRLPIEPTSRRETISADLWELLEIDFAESQAEARGIRLIKIEVLKPAFNVDRVMRISPVLLGPVPDQGQPQAPEPQARLEHNDDFSIVRLGSDEFKFGAAAANVVRLLHENADVVGGWVHGKKLMADARAEGTKVGDLFKRHTKPSWRLLIAADTRGHYRLKAR